jgi:hypothetical protein
MWEIYKSGSVRGVELLKGSYIMSTRQYPFQIFLIIITLHCCILTVCVAPEPPKSVKVIERLIQRLQASPCNDRNACLVAAINTDLDSDLKVYSENPSAGRIVFHSDSSGAGLNVTLQIDATTQAHQWTLELRYTDSATVTLSDFERVFGKANSPEWSRKTKSNHYVIFDALPPSIGSDIRISGNYNYLSSTGIPLLNSIKIIHHFIR